MQIIEQTLDSREVAEMIEKDHSKLLRDLRRYEEQFAEANIGFSDFFRNSEYKDCTGRKLPCYRITKKGCEFIAHKLTGTKGTIFTARYINRFHEMQNILSKKETESEDSWFIHKFKGQYIMLFRDFKCITGGEIFGNYTAWGRVGGLIGGIDYNGWGWYKTVDKEAFKEKYGFEYGDDKCMNYLYPCGIRKALKIYKEESGRRINQEAYGIIKDGLEAIALMEKKAVGKREGLTTDALLVKIGIIVGNEQRAMISL